MLLVWFQILASAGLLRVVGGADDAATTSITFRGGVLNALPFATVEKDPYGYYQYGGVQADMLERMKIFAKEDNITLHFDLQPAPEQYGDAFDLVANDCNTTLNPNLLEDCNKFDIIIANFYSTPERSMRADLSPPWLPSAISTIKYLDKKILADVTTMDQVSQTGAPVCLKNGTFYAGVVQEKFPKVNYLMCDTQEICLEKLKAEECVLYATDELQLRYAAANDATLKVTPESFNSQYIVWAMKDDTPNVRWLKKWVYQLTTNTTMDELFFKYFQKELCPVGTAGEKCELPCDPDHGQADERGVCVCRSNKWKGRDCSIEVPEDLNLIPPPLKVMAYTFVGINCFVIVTFAFWLYWKRETTQVRISQPFFLLLILLGCLISTLTIVAMAEEDEGNGPVPACMAIPWLYSVGFSVTFGTLFAKIRRVYLIFKSAADFRRHKITFRETMAIIGAVLLVDVLILTLWTIIDPLHWERTTITTDQFGEPLESEGHCTCDSWQAWIGTISVLHLQLLAVACYLCYRARDIPTQFSEGKYVAIAMFSNLQIFIIGVPILIILGSDPESSFFVRTVIVWMNDFVVITLIFGNLIYHVHFSNHGGAKSDRDHVSKSIGSAIQQFSSAKKERSILRGVNSRLSSSSGLSNSSIRSNSRLALGDVEVMEELAEEDESAAMSMNNGRSNDSSDFLASPDTSAPVAQVSFSGSDFSGLMDKPSNASLILAAPVSEAGDANGNHEQKGESPGMGKHSDSTQSTSSRNSSPQESAIAPTLSECSAAKQ